MILIGLVIFLAAMGMQTTPSLSAAARPHSSWGEVQSFAYWLQDIDASKVAAWDSDLMVLDHSADGSTSEIFTPLQVEAMRTSKRPKRLLCYMSIGEAEPYRFYWRKGWKPGRPAWLVEPNPDWPDNYRVRYWDRDWQDMILGSPESYLDRILAAGFDGVYLDIVDGYQTFEKDRPSARQEMIDLVCRIARYAREKRPGFGVFPQNALELVEDPVYLETITGVGKESTWFTWGNKRRQREDTRWEEGWMDKIAAAGKVVLAVDYCSKPKLVREVKRRCEKKGFLSYCTTRELDRLVPQPR